MGKKNNEETIFIDRDSERFSYILDFMCDGLVHLPSSISKEALLNDFQYYGFEKISTDDLKLSLTVSDVMNQLESWKTLYDDTIQSLEASVKKISNYK
jgi:BTB/POZ domain